MKVLFGRVIKITVNMTIPQQQEIKHFNATEIIEIESKTKHNFEKDKPDFGFTSSARFN